MIYDGNILLFFEVQFTKHVLFSNVLNLCLAGLAKNGGLAMIDLYEFVSQNDQYAIGANMLVEIRDAYKFDIIKAICFSQNRSHLYVRIGCKKDRKTEQIEYNYLLNIDNIDKSFFALMEKENKIVFYTFNIKEDQDQQTYSPLIKKAKTEVYYPLIDLESNEVFGCIYLCSMKKIKMDYDKFFRNYRFACLNNIISALHKEVKQSNHTLSFLKLFDDFLTKNNPQMLRHHYNIAYLSNKIADEMNMDFNDRIRLYYASLLHDIGEIYINNNILNKSGKLTEKEYQIIRNHVVYGANLAKQILDDNNKEVIATLIMQHHERYDGKGYPHGLTGEETDIKSRIISVADAVDAMISGRSYKSAMSVDETINELKAHKGTQFDPTIVDIMIKILYERTSSDIEEIPIIAATLSIFTKEHCFLTPGTLMRKESVYEFHPKYTSDLDMIEWTEISQLTLSYIANQDIFEYQVTFLEIKDGVIYLSTLECKSTMIYYGLFWELSGVIYIDETTIVPIKTTRVSGDAIIFFVVKEVATTLEMNKLYKICLLFDDADLENITGMISKQYSNDQEVLNYFTFYNMPDALKDRIIKRIFQKQVSLKNRLLNDLY